MAYSLEDFGRMLIDRRRIEAYAAAIRRAVRPGSIVLELGTGTGFMALLACRAGAARVHAVDPNPVIQIARKAARDNGLEDRIVFHPTVSGRIDLPERCDVLISDMRGMMPCVGRHFIDLIDARERLLVPDATWVCQRDRLHVAVARMTGGGQQFLATWDGSPWGLDLSSALPHATNTPLFYRAAPGDLLSGSAVWATIDYPHLATPHVRGRESLEILHEGEAHGLTMWFDAELFGGVGFSTAPGVDPHVYGNMFLPWSRPVALRRGDRVDVRLDAISAHGTCEWSWQTIIRRGGEKQPLAEFRQSKFQGRLLEPGQIGRRLPQHKPRPTTELAVEKFLLGLVDGDTSQGTIAGALLARFPGRFDSEAAALAHIAETIERLRDES